MARSVNVVESSLRRVQTRMSIINESNSVEHEVNKAFNVRTSFPDFCDSWEIPEWLMCKSRVQDWLNSSFEHRSLGLNERCRSSKYRTNLVRLFRACMVHSKKGQYPKSGFARFLERAERRFESRNRKGQRRSICY